MINPSNITFTATRLPWGDKIRVTATVTVESVIQVSEYALFGQPQHTQVEVWRDVFHSLLEQMWHHCYGWMGEPLRRFRRTLMESEMAMNRPIPQRVWDELIEIIKLTEYPGDSISKEVKENYAKLFYSSIFRSCSKSERYQPPKQTLPSHELPRALPNIQPE